MPPRDALTKAPKKADVVITTYGYPPRLPWLAERPWDTIVAVLYQSSVEALTRQLRDHEGIERRGVILALLTRFKQIYNHPSQSRDDAVEKLLVSTQLKEIADPLGYLPPAEHEAQCHRNQAAQPALVALN